MGSAFAKCALVFLGDGVYQIKKQQNTDSLGVKDYSVSYGVLRDYGVERIVCRTSDLNDKGLSEGDLAIDVEVLEDAEIKALLDQANQVL